MWRYIISRSSTESGLPFHKPITFSTSTLFFLVCFVNTHYTYLGFRCMPQTDISQIGSDTGSPRRKVRRRTSKTSTDKSLRSCCYNWCNMHARKDRGLVYVDLWEIKYNVSICNNMLVQYVHVWFLKIYIYTWNFMYIILLIFTHILLMEKLIYC